TGSSGVAPYSYSWTTGQTGSNIVVSSAGSYGVTVEDADGCTGTADVDIIEAPSPTLNLPEEIKTCDQLYELCGLAVEDPQGNYEYQWSVYDPNTQTTQLVTDNPCFYPLLTVWGHAQYTVKVTNEYGCSTVRTINVRPAKGCGSLNEGGRQGMITTVHPNPIGVGESFKIEMDSDTETATLEIIDIKTGKIVYTSELSNDRPVEHAISDFNSDNSPSVYFIKVYNETGVAIERLVVK
ncbi:MAG: T9SS type A sorting domain-containing protein, partial [Crocinitomicaceae bacterium]